jgi:hypothetical protein
MLAARETNPNRKAQIACVVRLLDRVISLRDAWDAVSEEEWRLLHEVGVLTGQRVPSDAFDSASALMGFLVMTRFILEHRAKLLSKVDVH